MPSEFAGGAAWRGGLAVPLPAPFDAEDRLVPDRLAPVAAAILAAGAAALVVNDPIGEAAALSPAEAAAMQAAAAPLAGGRAAVLAGLGGSLGFALPLARRAAADGAAAVLVAQPRGGHVAPRGVVAYVARLAEAAALPVLLRLEDTTLGLPAIEALTRIEGFAGFAWACPDPLLLAEAIRRTPPGTVFLAALDEAWAAPLAAAGARGMIAPLGCLLPAAVAALHRALAAGDGAAARAVAGRLAPWLALLAEERGGAAIAVLKAGLALRGAALGAARPPAAWPLPPGSAARLRALLAAWALPPLG